LDKPKKNTCFDKSTSKSCYAEEFGVCLPDLKKAYLGQSEKQLRTAEKLID
jgi:hypothetical protein